MQSMLLSKFPVHWSLKGLKFLASKHILEHYKVIISISITKSKCFNFYIVSQLCTAQWISSYSRINIKYLQLILSASQKLHCHSTRSSWISPKSQLILLMKLWTISLQVQVTKQVFGLVHARFERENKLIDNCDKFTVAILVRMTLSAK